MALATYFNALALLVFGAVWLAMVGYLRAKKGKSALFLLFFTVFYIYLYKVLDYTLIQYQSLILLKLVSPNLILSGYAPGADVNLVPLITLTRNDWATSFLNVLLFVPFGLGLPFVATTRLARTVLLGMCLSIAIEVLQFTSGRISGTSFRIADINDVIFNSVGAAIGYLLFYAFVRLVRALCRNRELATHPLARYITERPQVPQGG